MSKHLTHLLDVYPVELHLLTTGKQWRGLGEKLPPHLTDRPTSVGLTCSRWEDRKGLLHVLVWVDSKWHRENGHDLEDTIVHEAVHAAAAVLDHVQQGYDATSEALAYLVEWIARWLRQSLA